MTYSTHVIQAAFRFGACPAGAVKLFPCDAVSSRRSHQIAAPPTNEVFGEVAALAAHARCGGGRQKCWDANLLLPRYSPFPPLP